MNFFVFEAYVNALQELHFNWQAINGKYQTQKRIEPTKLHMRMENEKITQYLFLVQYFQFLC